jgi:hypothetical protein
MNFDLFLRSQWKFNAGITAFDTGNGMSHDERDLLCGRCRHPPAVGRALTPSASGVTTLDDEVLAARDGGAGTALLVNFKTGLLGNACISQLRTLSLSTLQSDAGTLRRLCSVSERFGF